VLKLYAPVAAAGSGSIGDACTRSPSLTSSSDEEFSRLPLVGLSRERARDWEEEVQ
jgi:hypothetical protein